MSKLKSTWEKLKRRPNGEKVGLRMAQVLDFSLAPENEGYSLSAGQVVNIIALWEEKLLNRSTLEVFQDPILINLARDMRDSSDEEWDKFKKEVKLQPLDPSEAGRLLIDSSGLVRNAGFEAWVLGETNSPITSEGPDTKAYLLNKKGS